jgi:hypothetical protein
MSLIINLSQLIKLMKLVPLTVVSLIAVLFVSCAPRHVYVPVYVETKAKPKPQKVVYRTKPTPKRVVESAESFRAVDRPTTYSN